MIPGPYRNIALIGFMGSGKSTLAGQLAERLGWDVADSDAEVEREAGKPIPRIFLEDGEAAFRELEERAVARLAERIDVVIALGGGAITSPVTRERLRDGSFTVLLDVSVQTAWRRIEAEADDRPLAVEARGFAELYEQRRPLYHAAADALVDAEQLEGGEPLLVPLSRPAALAELPRLVGARRAALIADRAVLRLVGAPVEPLVTVRLPVGEAAKTVAVARQAWTRLADLGLERGDVVVGLGGGAATDTAGFVAATYQRGVPWIAAPTSLVGMVDAAIGGKTGIDLPGAKNYVGAFHPAEWVVTDPGLLETLPVREWACGFAEVIKTGLLAGGPAVGDGAGVGAGPGSHRAAAGADPPLRRLQGPRGGDRSARAGHARRAQPGPLDRPRDRGRGRVHRHRPRRGGGGGAAAGAVAVGQGCRPRPRAGGRRAGAAAEARAAHRLRAASTRRPCGRRFDATRSRSRAVSGSCCWRQVGKPVWGVDVDDELIDLAIERALAG